MAFIIFTSICEKRMVSCPVYFFPILDIMGVLKPSSKWILDASTQIDRQTGTKEEDPPMHKVISIQNEHLLSHIQMSAR